MSEPEPGRPAVSVVVVDAAHRVLLFPVSDGEWSVLMGRPKPGEELEVTARRLIETATAQRVGHLVGPVGDPATGLTGLDAVVMFLCRAEAFQVQRGRQDLPLNRGQWWPLTELPDACGPLSPAALEGFVARYL